jgi:tetratricopeptide (TPR) repeat protein
MTGLPAAPDTAARVDELLGMAYRSRHDDTRKALGFARQAHELSDRTGHAPGRAWALLRMALCEHILADPKRQYEQRLGESIALMRDLGDQAGEAEAMNLLGSILNTRGEHEAALDLYRRCRELRETLGDLSGVTAAMNNVGLTLRMLSRTGEALDWLGRSLEIALAQADTLRIAYAHLNLGEVFLDLDDAATAIEHLEQAFSRVARTEDRALECSILIGLARSRALQGANDAALGLLQHAQGLALRTGNVRDQARVAMAQAAVEQGRGGHAAAEAHLHATLASLRRAEERTLEADVLVRLAHSQWQLGRADAALGWLERALELASSTGQALVADSARRLTSQIRLAG